MNKQKELNLRATVAESILVVMMVEIAIMGSMPEYRDPAIYLLIPFLVYGLIYVLFINK